jgi:hypothetical protein
MNIFQELNESRLFRTQSRLDGLKRSDMARKFFTHMMALRVLYEESPDAAKAYANLILRWPDFDGFRSACNDLYNIISVLMNKERFADQVPIDTDFTMPDLRLRRILRRLQQGKIDRDDYDNFLMILQRTVPGLSSQHMSIRRELSDYNRLGWNAKSSLVRRLLLLIREPDVFTDLHIELLKHLKNPRLAL